MANLSLDIRSDEESQPAVKAVDVSVVIVTWNSERWIDRCLRSIDRAAEGLEVEVVLHDNASSDGTLAVVDRTLAGGGEVPYRVQLIRSAENAGFAAGTNRGIAGTTGRYVLLLNPDCELRPHALTTLVEFLDARPAAAAAAPLLSDESGTSQRHSQLRRFPTLGMLVAELMLVHKMFPRNPATSRYRYAELRLDEPRLVEQPAASALLLRREAFEKVGPFDEQFRPAWFEDVDFCRRLAQAGLDVWIVPAAKGRHFGGASLQHMDFGRFADIWYRNMWRYAQKWLSPGRVEALRIAIIAGMLLRIGAAVLGITPRVTGRRAAIRAYASVIRSAARRWGDAH